MGVIELYRLIEMQKVFTEGDLMAAKLPSGSRKETDKRVDELTTECREYPNDRDKHFDPGSMRHASLSRNRH